MKTLQLLLLFLFVNTLNLLAQSASLIKPSSLSSSSLAEKTSTANFFKTFDKTFGGQLNENLVDIKSTADGGYLLGGYSDSGQTGDKSQTSQGNVDYWVVKINASGTKVWDKRFGGTAFDYFGGIQPTADGGFLLAGYTDSGQTGDKSQASQGGSDYWVIKIDANGTKVWDKAYGGASYEYLSEIQPTADGGFLLGGFTDSGQTGDKSQASQGGSDYWVVKIDANGTKVWDKTFGGSGAETLTAILPTADGFLLGGYSSSAQTGDKSQGSQGGSDYWVVKIDVNGTKVWDKRFGGTGEDFLKVIQATGDGNFLVGGYSYSGQNGDKTQGTQGGADYWLLKIDTNGGKIWDKRFGGTNDDVLSDLKTLPDGTFIVGGYSASDQNGDKSQNSLGSYDYWVLNVDANGTKILDKSFGGAKNDNLISIQLTSDGGFLMGGTSSTGISGDKSEASRGQVDYWIVKVQNCQLATPTISANGATSFCIGSSVTLSATVNNVTYEWQKNGVAASTQNNIVATTAGSYTLKITDAQTCTAISAPIVVVVNSLPQSNVTASSSTTFCDGGTVVLSAPTGNNYTYQWAKNDTTINGAISKDFTVTKKGIYSVKVTSAGCVSKSSNVQIQVNASPTVPILSASGSTTICQGSSAALSIPTTAGYTYQWFKDNVLQGVTTNIYSATTTGNYSAQVTNSLNCSALSNVLKVTVNALPSATITPQSATSFCDGGSVVLSAPAGNGYKYQWLEDGNILANATSQNLTAKNAGNYDLQVTSGDGCISKSASYVPIFVNPLPSVATINTGTTATICQGDVLTLTANNASGNGLTFQWIKDASFIVGATNNNYSASVTGNYTIKLTTAQGCSTTSNGYTLTVNPLPVSTITPQSTTTFCDGDLVVLMAPAATGNTYQWLQDNNVISGATAQSFTAKTTGKYTLKVTSGSNCSNVSAQTAVTVNPLPTVPSITIKGALNFCPGYSVSLTAKSNNGVAFKWLKDGVAANLSDSSIVIKTSGVYSVQASFPSGCSTTSSSVTTKLFTAPVKSVTVQGNVVFCQGGSATLTASAATGQTYQWWQNGSPVSGSTAVNLTATTAGKYLVKVTTADGCLDSSAVTSITVNPLPPIPVVTADGVTTFCVGGTVTLKTTPIAGSTYQWYSNDITAPISGATNATYKVTDKSSYGVKITDANGCSSISTSFLPVNVIAIPKPTITQTDDKLNSSSTSGNQWFYNGAEIPGATAAQIKLSGTGKYSLQVSLNGCQSPFSDDFVPVILATELPFSINIYPNPAQENIFIATPMPVQVSLVDGQGKRILIQSLQQSGEVKVAHLARGLYILEVSSKNGGKVTKKVVLE